MCGGDEVGSRGGGGEAHEEHADIRFTLLEGFQCSFSTHDVPENKKMSKSKTKQMEMSRNETK